MREAFVKIRSIMSLDNINNSHTHMRLATAAAQLPSEVLRHIFIMVEDPKVALVCKKWKEVMEQPSTYRLLLTSYQKESPRFTRKFRKVLPEECKLYVKNIYLSVMGLAIDCKVINSMKDAKIKIHTPLDLIIQINLVEEDVNLIKFFGRLIEYSKFQFLEPRSVLESVLCDKMKADALRSWLGGSTSLLTQITKLNLKGLKLTKLPREIGLFVNLKKLKLQYNRLTELPPEFSNLIALNELNLECN